tara:strand:- start:709 stop:1362 length:654 start_codon:yes stop_codon:yes gene_type:complete
MEETIDISKSRIFNDLVEYTNLPRNQVLQKCASSEKELVDLWNKKQNILDFYKNSDLYLFDLTKYQLILEHNNKIKEMIKQIKELKLNKILEYGGGIGEFSLLCCENKFSISYYDLDGKVRDYALWRFKKHNCEEINIKNESCLDEEWDVVNIMDVLEHLENPNEIILKLKEKARYIFCNPFEIKYNKLCPQHISKFDLSKDFEQINNYLWKNKYKL